MKSLLLLTFLCVSGPINFSAFGSTQISTLSTSQISTLSTSQVAALSTSQIAALTPSQLARYIFFATPHNTPVQQSFDHNTSYAEFMSASERQNYLLKSKENTINDLNSQIETLKRELKDSNSEKDTLNRQLVIMEQTLADTNVRAQRALMAVEQHKQKLESRLQKSENAAATLYDENELLKSRLQKLEGTETTLNDKIKRLRQKSRLYKKMLVRHAEQRIDQKYRQIQLEFELFNCRKFIKSLQYKLGGYKYCRKQCFEYVTTTVQSNEALISRTHEALQSPDFANILARQLNEHAIVVYGQRLLKCLMEIANVSRAYNPVVFELELKKFIRYMYDVNRQNDANADARNDDAENNENINTDIYNLIRLKKVTRELIEYKRERDANPNQPVSPEQAERDMQELIREVDRFLAENATNTNDDTNV